MQIYFGRLYGGIQQLRGQNFAIFYVDFFYPERGQKQTFLTPPPPYLVHVVTEWPLWSYIPDLHAN